VNKKPLPKLDAGRYMKEKVGLEFAGIDSDNNRLFRTPDGNEIKLDVERYLAEKRGVPVGKFDLEFNTPETAYEASPLGALDRLALTFGNEKGKMDYLRGKFDGVSYNPDKGIVVKNKGVWQQVDPSGLGEGDAWQRSAELLKDVVDLGDVIGGGLAAWGGAAIGAAGGAVAGPGGAIAGGVAGAGAGGAAFGALRTELGKLVGTYDASPEEQLQDIGWEMLLASGGQAAPAVFRSAKEAAKWVGRRPAISEFSAALKEIGTNATDSVKDILAQTYGKMTGAGTEAMHHTMNNTDRVIGTLKGAAKGLDTETKVIDKLAIGNIKDADGFIKTMDSKLSTLYGEMKDAVIEKSGNLGRVDFKQSIDEALESLAQEGVVKRKIVASSGGQVQKVEYLPMDRATAAKLVGLGEEAEFMIKPLQKQVNEMLATMKEMQGLGAASGKEAAERLLKLKKSVNQTGRQVRTAEMPKEYERVFKKIEDSVNVRVGEEFSKAGLGMEYAQLANTYGKYADAVHTATTMSKNQVKGSEVFINALTSPGGMNPTYKMHAESLIELGGQSGVEFHGRIMDRFAAQKFAPILSRSGLVPQVVGGGAVLGAASGGITGGAAAGILAATSPRVALNNIQAARKVSGFLRGLSPMARAEFLSDPNATRAIVQILGKTQEDGQALEAALLQQAGGGQ